MVCSEGRKELVKSYDDAVMSQSPSSGLSPSTSEVQQPQLPFSTSNDDVPDCLIHYVTSVNRSTSRSVDWDDVSYYTPNEDSPLNSRTIVAAPIDTDLQYRLRRRGVNLMRLQRVRRRLFV